MMRHIKKLLLISTLMAAMSPVVSAGPIISATDAIINSGASYPDVDNDIVNTYNQAGLYDQYIDNVTDFDTYIASAPYHTSDYNNQEWFSDGPDVSVTYDLGRLVNVNALALWNEETTGINIFDLFGSNDGVDFYNLASNLTPTDNPFDFDRPNEDYRYLPDRFNFESSYLQYLRFDISGCHDDTNTFNFCSIGEVAFRVTDVPEPEPLAIFCLGLLAIAVGKNRTLS